MCTSLHARMHTHVGLACATHLQDLCVSRLTANVLRHLHQSPPTVHGDKAHGDTPRHSSQWCCIDQLLGLGMQEELSRELLTSLGLPPGRAEGGTLPWPEG